MPAATVPSVRWDVGAMYIVLCARVRASQGLWRPHPGVPHVAVGMCAATAPSVRWDVGAMHMVGVLCAQ